MLSETLVGGKAGVGGVYDWWRSVAGTCAAAIDFRAEHGDQGVLPAPRGSVMIAIGLAAVVLVLAAIPALLFRANLREYRPPPRGHRVRARMERSRRFRC